MTTRRFVILAVLNFTIAATVGILAGMVYKGIRGRQEIHVDKCEQLREKIAALADTVDAEVGVAVISGDGDTLEYVNSDRTRFPLMSVMKFHQALYVCHWLKNAGQTLDSVMEVLPERYEENTWSPLRDSHPEGGTFSYGDLLSYTLGHSDNIACDILFELTGGPECTGLYIRSLGVDDFNIECTESMMHEDLSLCMENWSTPLSSAMLLEEFMRNRDKDEFMRFIWNTMSECKTGTARIPGRISEKTAAIVHKTGTGDVADNGRIIAVNDIGIVVMPDGTHFSLSVFIHNAACTMSQCEALIAAIAEAVYEHALSESDLSPDIE